MPRMRIRVICPVAVAVAVAVAGAGDGAVRRSVLPKLGNVVMFCCQSCRVGTPASWLATRERGKRPTPHQSIP